LYTATVLITLTSSAAAAAAGATPVVVFSACKMATAVYSASYSAYLHVYANSCACYLMYVCVQVTGESEMLLLLQAVDVVLDAFPTGSYITSLQVLYTLDFDNEQPLALHCTC
jgi:hypothetical protein